MLFDLQRFGGKGGTTVQSTYEPTKYELELQALEVDYTNAIMPNALELNSAAKNLLDAVEPFVEIFAASLHAHAQDAVTRVGWQIEDYDEGIYLIKAEYASLKSNTSSISGYANNQWETKLTATNGLFDTFSNDLDTIKSTVSNKITAYNSTITSYDTKVADYSGAITEYGNRISSYQPTITAYNSKATLYDSTISAYNSTVSGYSTPITKYEYKADDYDSVVSAYDTKITTYNDTISAYNSTVNGYATPITDYVERVDDYKPTIVAYDSIANNYVTSINAYSTHVSDIKDYYVPTISANANKSLSIAEATFNSLYPSSANTYDTIYSGYSSAEQSISNKTITLPTALSNSVTLVSGALDTITGDYKNATIIGAIQGTSMKHDLTKISTTNYNDLDTLAPQFVSVAGSINPELDSISSDADKLTTLGTFYNNLDSLIPEYNKNYKYANSDDTVHSNFENLIDGSLPSAWQNHMENSIKTVLQNTIGETVNDLANRGVINSSVTNQALYDIERNASDEVAKQYLQNIQTESQLVQNRWQVKEQGLNDQKLVIDDMLGFFIQGLNLQLQAQENKYQNLTNSLRDEAQIYNYQLNNTSQVLTNQANLANNKFAAQSSAINSTDQFYEQMLQDKYNMLQGQANANQGKFGVWQTAYQLNLETFARKLNEMQLKIQQWDTLLQKQHDGYKLRDSLSAQKDNLLRQRDSIFQLQDNLLRQRDGVYQLRDNLLGQRDRFTQTQDNLLRQRDSIFQLQDNLLRQRDGIYQLRDNLLGQRDRFAQTQDNLLRQRDSIFQLQDNLLRQRDGIYQLRDNLLGQRDRLSQAQDNLLKQLSDIDLNWYQAAKNTYDTQWAHQIARLEHLMKYIPIENQTMAEIARLRELQAALVVKDLIVASAAQEAVHQPALRLWNASTGLNQAATGALVALSNQGTRTQTQSSEGNFWGGVLSAGISAFAGGFGASYGAGMFGA